MSERLPLSLNYTGSIITIKVCYCFSSLRNVYYAALDFTPTKPKKTLARSVDNNKYNA